MVDVARLARAHIDRAAAKADRAPSAGQKEAGNYRVGKIRFHGLDISIENPRGSIRSGTDKGGKPWRVTLPDHYGYIRRTEGSDGDHVDCYIGRHPLSHRVFVVDQVDADSKEHDEHKVMLGYVDKAQALSAYRRAFSDGRGEDRIGSVKEMDIGQLKRWLQRTGGLPKYADGGSVGFAEGGTPDTFDPAEFAAFKAPAAPSGGGFDPAEFAAFKQPKPDAAPIPGDIGAMMPEAYQDPNSGVGASLVKAAKAAPHSAMEFAKNTVTPILHPVDTMTGIKNLGLGVLEKSGLVPGSEHEKYADEVGHFFASRYGGLENAKRTFEQDPVGMAGDLSMLLSGGETALGRIPGVTGEVARAAGATGRAVDPVNAAMTVAAPVARGIGNTAAEIAGVTTGVGGQPLKVAARAGYEGGPAAQAFRENLNGTAPLEDAVNEARGAVSQIRKERGDEYRAKMGPIKADSAVLDFSDIDAAVAKAQGVKTYAGRSGTGPTQVLHPKTEGIRKEMGDAIEHWKGLDPAEFHTPEGIDALKQQLGDIRDATQYGSPDRKVADSIYHAVRQTIVDQVPAYAKVMKGYEEASKTIKEIETTLSLKPNANIDTALRKLQSTLRDNVNTSFGRRTELANFLTRAGAPHLMERLAGQALHAWVPRGLARLATMESIPAIAAGLGAGAVPAAAGAAAMLPTMSPRLMGEVAYGAGRAGRLAAPVLNAVARPARQIGQVMNAPPFGDIPNPYAR